MVTGGSVIDDDTFATASATTLATSESIKNFVGNGWTPALETWTYASADDPTYTFTISGDLTDKYSAGMRIKLTQTTAKYFIITKVAYSSPNTTITVYGGTDYDLANATITNPYYSVVKAPQGFPLDPDKWSVEQTDSSLRSQDTPTASTWYNLGTTNCQLSIPIGIWEVSFKVCVAVVAPSATIQDIANCLSTTNNSMSDSDFYVQSYTNDTIYLGVTHFVKKTLVLTSKTTYYLNTRTTKPSMSNFQLDNSSAPSIIRATCAYL